MNEKKFLSYLERYSQWLKAHKEKSNEELANILGMDSIYRIDVFDNSNLFGSFAVSGMVVFIDGKPVSRVGDKLNYDGEVLDGDPIVKIE